jgi:hypothetical protein
MTIRELLIGIGNYPKLLICLFTLLPISAVALGRIHARHEGGTAPWKFIYAIIVFAVCIPGIAAVVLTGYELFFSRENLLDLNLIVYYLPILSMVITLIIISKNVSFDSIPGFGRLTGLFIILAITFISVLAIQKTSIWLVFGGSIYSLLIIGLGVYFVLRWAVYLMFRKRS